MADVVLRDRSQEALPHVTITVAGWIADRLQAEGITHAFGVDGANIEDLYVALAAREGIRPIIAKHEFSAASMADGFARATSRLAVALATSGGGALNLVAGIAEAFATGVPMLVLVGQPPRQLHGKGAFQDGSGLGGSLDLHAVFRPVSRFCESLRDPGQIITSLPAAIEAARRLRGPAVLLLPKDVQRATIAEQPPQPAVMLPAPATPRTTAAGPDLLPEALELIRGVVSTRGRILVIGGTGIQIADARIQLQELSDVLGAWTAVTPDARDAVDPARPGYAGLVGVMGHTSATDCLRQADLVIAAGTRIPAMSRNAEQERLLADVPVISFGRPVHAPVGRTAPELTVVGDLRTQLARLARACQHVGEPAKPAEPLMLRGFDPRVRDGAGVRYADIARALAQTIPAGANVVIDAGNAAASAIHALPLPSRGRYVLALGMGGMGHSFGAGLGVAFGTGRRTVVLAGDGGFYMHGMEIHTAVQYDLPVTFVIYNNNAHAMCATRGELLLRSPSTLNRFRPADIGAGLAATFPSLSSVTVRTAEDLLPALRRSLQGDSPAVVCIECDPTEIPPFAPLLDAFDALDPGETDA